MEIYIIESANFNVSGESRALDTSLFDEMLLGLEVTAKNGAPTTATLDVKLQVYISNARGAEAGTGGYWVDLPTKKISDDSQGDFTQVTEATSLPSREVRYVNKPFGAKVKIVYTIVLVGGTAPSWTFSVTLIPKPKYG